jgi:hypothetical protein
VFYGAALVWVSNGRGGETQPPARNLAIRPESHVLLGRALATGWHGSHFSKRPRNQEPEALCYSGGRDMASTIPNGINLQYSQRSIDKR